MFDRYQQLLNTLKRVIADDFLFTCVLLVLVSLASFGLGRYSVATQAEAVRPVLLPTPVEIPTQAAAVVMEESPLPTAGSLVASVNGTKYHALTCPGAKQISEKNKLYFQSEAEARSAGYTPAANCSF